LRAAFHSVAAVAAVVAAPVVAGALVLRPGWRVGARERLGGVGLGGAGPGAGASAASGAVWVHGASVGEILAATRLVDRLREANHSVVTSTQTLTGRGVMRVARPEVPCQLAPLDHPWCVERALARARPAALALIETELWPCWIAAADRRGIPVVLVSGRVSDRSFARYRRVRPLVGRMLRRLEAIGARTPEDAERFAALGAPPGSVVVSGDLKLDGVELPRPPAADLDRALGGAPLFVVGSTHPGEERAALAALRAVEDAGLRAVLLLAPRHQGRVSEVERIARGEGRPVHRRTDLPRAPLRPGEVLLLDSVGELASLYARADAAFVGGSLAPVGGHNVLEPVFCGRPVLFGPHTQNVGHAVDILECCGAGRRVADAGDLGRAVVELLADPAAARARGERGRDALDRHRGSAERAARLVESAVSARASGSRA
jgi:3-deoxy-D-manno-octulosonic-acid transferase